MNMSFRVREKNQKRVAKERNLVERSEHAPLKIVLCYPNRYGVGMANLGFQRVYQLFNQIEGVYCDRAFYPDPGDEDHHFQKRVPLLGIESGRPISEFDVVAFSFAFELDYFNCLKMLAMSGVPARAKERVRDSGRKHRYPLLIAGGIAVSANPEPMADFFDLVVIGEAEPVMHNLTELLKKNQEDLQLEEFSKLSNSIESIYVPSADHSGQGPIIKAAAKENELPACQQIFSPEMEFAELGLIELMRGCRRGCRFCLEGYFYRPAREAGLNSVIAGIEELRKYRSKLGLIAAVVPDYGKFKNLLDYLESAGTPFSISSLRIEAINERLVALLKKSGNQTVTLAPETGLERARSLINKKINEEKILQGMKIIGRCGFERVKLYYQVGFHGCGLEEADGIVESVRKIREALEAGSGKNRYPGVVDVGVSVFVPKPWTALQWAGMQGKNELDEKMKMLREELGRQAGVEIHLDSVREALLQGIIARGDRALGSLLEDVAFNRKTLNEIIKDKKILQKYLRPREKDEVLPWEVIDPGVKKAYLWTEFERGLAGKTSRGCRSDCLDCGAC